MLAYLIAGAGVAFAHTSEQAFVLLLPTELYTAAGVGAVAMTMLIIAVLPHDASNSFFTPVKLIATPFIRSADVMSMVTSMLSLAIVVMLVGIGFAGPRGPLENLLPLSIWTLWWMGFVALQALFGDLWHWINPWTGAYRLLSATLNRQRFLKLPARLGSWPGVAVFLAFAVFMLADIAPDDPARLAAIVAAYWICTFAGMVIFGGEEWLGRVECFTIVLRFYARLAIFARKGQVFFAGLSCWRLVRMSAIPYSGSVLILLLLGTGSFDGLNETFWWLAKIGINPLEFPGRSAVFWQTTFGLFAANLLLIFLFALVVQTGLMLAGSDVPFSNAFGLFSLAVLPIALGYHVAHFLTAFLVQAQYALVAISDPMKSGADFLGLGRFYVTTGFFNSRDTVEIIWLSQAGAVVLGHVMSVAAGHALATRLFSRSRQVLLSQIPLAVFMILYTLFGLWLLATPRGA